MKFTQDNLRHIRENGYSPARCEECRAIDKALQIETAAPKLYEALKESLISLQANYPQEANYAKAVIKRALALVEGEVKQ